jgi:4'-phosphopantetheinyl transferase
MPDKSVNDSLMEGKLQAKKCALKCIHPVLLPVAADKRTLAGREKVAHLSARAREALALSARESGIALGRLEKNTDGAPLPSNGTYWSLAHKSAYVVAVAADVPIGIDIEKQRAVTPGLYRRIATGAEWRLADADRERLFFRYWTAKEAVLKVAGTGIRELVYCRIVAVTDDHSVQLDFKGEPFQVRQFFHDQHVIAVVDVGCEIKLKMVHP